MQLTVFQEGNGSSNSYLGYDPDTKEAFIIDPGRDDASYEKFLEEKGLKLTSIILTHAHFDHIGGLERLRKATGARVYIGETEAKTMNDPKLNLSGMLGGESLQLQAPDVYLKPGDKIQVLPDEELEVIDTPGHTPGGICLYGNAILFSGDTLFEGSIGRTDFPGGSYSQIQQSLDKLMALPDDTTVLPGHGGTTTIGREKKINPFIAG